MNTIYNTYKASEEGFEKKFQDKDAPPLVAPRFNNQLNLMRNVKSFNRTSALALLESVREMIEGEKCKSCLEGLTNPSCGYNEPLNEIITLISQAEQLITHKCCNGECNHDDCCGKVEANCPLKQ